MTRIKVVYVEDEAKDTAIVTSLFEATGQFAVSTCSTVGDAVLMVQKEKPNILMLDWRLKITDAGRTEDAVQIAKVVREQLPEYRNMPILFYTQWIDAGSQVVHREDECIFWISKAEDPCILFAFIANIFLRWRPQ